jgi:hypothetical protein
MHACMHVRVYCQLAADESWNTIASQVIHNSLQEHLFLLSHTARGRPDHTNCLDENLSFLPVLSRFVRAVVPRYVRSIHRTESTNRGGSPLGSSRTCEQTDHGYAVRTSRHQRVVSLLVMVIGPRHTAAGHATPRHATHERAGIPCPRWKEGSLDIPESTCTKAETTGFFQIAGLQTPRRCRCCCRCCCCRQGPRRRVVGVGKETFTGGRLVARR